MPINFTKNRFRFWNRIPVTDMRTQAQTWFFQWQCKLLHKHMSLTSCIELTGTVRGHFCARIDRKYPEIPAEMGIQP